MKVFWKRAVIMAVLVVLNLVLLSTLLQNIRILGVIPNTTVILIVCYALLRGSGEGAVLGLCAGLLQDVFFGSSLGYYAVIDMLIGYTVGLSHKNFYRENLVFPAMLTAVCCAVYGGVVYLTAFFFQGYYNPFPYVVKTIVPETVYTTLLSMVCYRLLFAVNDSLERREARHRKIF